MKKTILLLTASILLFACNKQPSLVGEWTSVDKHGKEEMTIFKEDKSMVIIKNNKVKEFNFEDKSLKYEVDNSKTPNWFDMIVYDKKNNEEIMRVKGIYEFLSENTFRLCINGGKHDIEQALQRPSSFNEKNTTIFTKK